MFIEVAKNPVYQTPEVALLNAGVCVGSAGDVVDAERYFNRALAMKPNMPEALLQARQSRVRTRRLQAGARLRAALSGGQSGDRRNPLARIPGGRKLGDNTDAAVYGRRIQTEFPDSEQAQMLRSGVDR